MHGSRWPMVAALMVTCVLAGQSLACGWAKYQCRSKQSEASMELAQAMNVMETHRAEHGVYPQTMTELEDAGFAPEKKFYEYVLTATDDTYKLEALGMGDVAGDRWVVDESGITTHANDSCP